MKKSKQTRFKEIEKEHTERKESKQTRLNETEKEHIELKS